MWHSLIFEKSYEKKIQLLNLHLLGIFSDVIMFFDKRETVIKLDMEQKVWKQNLNSYVK
jgi:hypothetical protein